MIEVGIERLIDRHTDRQTDRQTDRREGGEVPFSSSSYYITRAQGYVVTTPYHTPY